MAAEKRDDGDVRRFRVTLGGARRDRMSIPYRKKRQRGKFKVEK
jgi:hypothetical protein